MEPLPTGIDFRDQSLQTENCDFEKMKSENEEEDDFELKNLPTKIYFRESEPSDTVKLVLNRDNAVVEKKEDGGFVGIIKKNFFDPLTFKLLVMLGIAFFVLLLVRAFSSPQVAITFSSFEMQSFSKLKGLNQRELKKILFLMLERVKEQHDVLETKINKIERLIKVLQD